MTTSVDDDDDWCNVDMDELGEGGAVTDGPVTSALHSLEVDPDHLEWPCTAEGGFGEPVDAAALCRGGAHCSVWALIRHAPRLLLDLLVQPDLLVSVSAEHTSVTVRPVWSPCALHQVVPHLLRQLTVYEVPGLPLVRVGATPGAPGFVTPRWPYHGDGGYVMADPTGTEVCYSYGIAQEVSFDTDLVLKHGVRLVRQFDMTLGGRYTPPLAEFAFVDEGVGPSRDVEARLDTLAAHVHRHGELASRKLLAMDVEGAEWAALWSCPGAVLASFDHVVLELHGLSQLRSMRFRAAVLAKLNLFFVVVHVHANNFGLDRSDAMRHKFEHVLGYKVPTTLEVSYVNKRLVPGGMASVLPSTRRLPCSLDQPNVRAPDIQLNVWPWGEGAPFR